MGRPTADLVRAIDHITTEDGAEVRGAELRAAGEGEAGPVLTGHFAVFNRWTEINSLFEGRFLERIAPGAFATTFRDDRPGMKILFQHGTDPQIGDKPIAGQIAELREDNVGAFYEAPLLAARYVTDDVQPGLEAGVYGASFRFQVMREDIVEPKKPTQRNPEKLTERTILEARVFEFGPVTFPAYPDASAGVRSLTDLFRRREAPLPARPVVMAAPARRFSSRKEYLEWISRLSTH